MNQRHKYCVPAILLAGVVGLWGCADDAGGPGGSGAQAGLPQASSTVLSGARGKGDQLDIPVSFDEFLAHVYCESDGRVCVVDGDTPIEGGMEGLRAFYERRVNPPGQALSVNWAERGDDLWYGAQRFDLSYCVSNRFAGQKQEVVDAMREAAEDWEAVATVKFVYRPEQDARCDLRNKQVLFPVMPAEDAGASYLARAFFPSYAPENQDVRINVDAVNESMQDAEMAGLSLRGILRHELGHVLGFRHEHTRAEAGAWYCFEDRNYRPGTSYDARSVMHYPQCDGQNDWALELSEVDAIGAAYFYPKAGVAQHTRCEVELNEDGTVREACAFVVRQITEWLSEYATREVIVDWMGLPEELVDPIATETADRPFTDLDDLKARVDINDVQIRQVYDYLFFEGRCPGAEVDHAGWLVPWCYPVVNRILELVNLASFETLNTYVGLDVRAVENIIAARERRPLDTYDALISLGYVKRVALSRLYHYLYEVDVTGE